MIAAEVIVLATPVYNYSMNGQLKTVIDHTYPKFMQIRERIFTSSWPAPGMSGRYMDTAVAGLRCFTVCVPKPKEKGVSYGIGVDMPWDVLGTPAFGQAFEMGKSV